MNKNKTNREGLWTGLLLLCSLAFCLVSCSQDEALRQAGEGTPVSLCFPSIEGGVSADTLVGTRAALDAEVKVRVVVYKTGAQSSANYLLTKDYTVQANGALVASDGVELRLIDGTYDFFAITPDLTVTTSGASPTVKVPDRIDFARSLTTGVKINKWTTAEGTNVQRAVTLTPLKRESAKISLTVELASDVPAAVTGLEIVKCTLASRYETVIFTGATGNPAASGGSKELIFDATYFTTDLFNPRKASGSMIVNAYSSATIKMLVKSNGINVLREFTLPVLALSAGYDYQYKATITRQGTVRVWLSSGSWVDAGEQYYIMGETDYTKPNIFLGEWRGVTYDSAIGSDDASENH